MAKRKRYDTPFSMLTSRYARGVTAHPAPAGVCVFVEWSRELHSLTYCGAPAERNTLRRKECLCKAHREYLSGPNRNF
jgi:hypothetical protein